MISYPACKLCLMHSMAGYPWDHSPVCSGPIREAVTGQPAPLWGAARVLLDGDSAEMKWDASGPGRRSLCTSPTPALPLCRSLIETVLWTGENNSLHTGGVFTLTTVLRFHATCTYSSSTRHNFLL